jgi:hypothetical protein
MMTAYPRYKSSDDPSKTVRRAGDTGRDIFQEMAASHLQDRDQPVFNGSIRSSRWFSGRASSEGYEMDESLNCERALKTNTKSTNEPNGY